jgi:hypothetical protein
LTLIAFFPSLSAQFLWDDYFHIKNVSNLNLANLFQAYVIEQSAQNKMLFWWTPEFRLKYFRPIASLLIYLDLKLFQLNPIGYHATNLLLHIFTSMFVYALAMFIFTEWRLAFFITFLFALHPAHSEAVNWISGQPDLLLGFFAIVCFYSYARFLQKRSMRWYLLAILAFLLALGSKEASAIIPILLGLYDLAQPRHSASPKTALLSRLKYHLPFFLILCSYLLARTWYFGAFSQLPEPYCYPPSHPDFWARVCENALYYTSNLLLLFPLSLFDLKIFIDIPALYFVILLIIGILGYICIFFQRSNRLTYFFLAFAALPLLPLLSLRYFQRLLYLPSIGFCFFLGMAIFQHFRNFKEKKEYYFSMQLMCLGLAVIYFSFAFMSSLVFRDYSNLGKSTIDQVMALRSSLPKDTPTDIYFIDVNMSESVAIESALKLYLDNPAIAVRVLTAAPRLIPAYGEYDGHAPLGLRFMSKFFPYWGEEFASQVTQIDAKTLKVEATKGSYLSQSLQKITMFSAPQIAEGDTFRTDRFDVNIRKKNYQGILEMIFSFKKDIAEPHQIFFLVNGLHITKLKF